MGLSSARKPSSLSDCTNDADDDSLDKSSSSSNSIHDGEGKQSLAPSFRNAVGYFDSNPSTSFAAKPLPNPGQQSPMPTRPARRLNVHQSTASKRHQSDGDFSAQLVHVPFTLRTNAAQLPLATRPRVIGGHGLNLSVPQSSYVFVPLLRTASSTLTSVSDEPEDLSVRTGARHVTRHVTAENSSPTAPANSRAQHHELRGKIVNI